MANLEDYKYLYRLQAPEIILPYKNSKDMPVKRVLISGVGKIEFNPDSNQYVYFSKTDKHHVYYIFNKVFKIVSEQINKAHMSKQILNKDVARVSDFYINYSRKLYKEVSDFLVNYVPPICVESVSIKYIEAYERFFTRCAINNLKKNTSNTPEITDVHNFGGAFGINSAWLDLLRSCTTETATSTIYLDDFFDYLCAMQTRFNSVRCTIRSFIVHNDGFIDLLKNFVKYKAMINPEFYDKNNINSMRKAVNIIYNNKLYEESKKLNRHDFQAASRELRDEIDMAREG